MTGLFAQANEFKLVGKFNIKTAKGDIPKNELFKNINIYIRPVRHDGAGLMVQEAQHLGIPTYWSYETGEYIEPDVKEIEKRIMELL